jgi:IS1 family transposase
LDGLRLEQSKVVQIVKLLAEGLGVRGTARVIGCDAHTVLAVLQTIGPKLEALHNRLVRNVQTDAIQLDELWSRVGVSQKYPTPDDEERGDFYSYLAIAAREKLIVSFHTGKRSYASTDEFIGDLSQRVPGRIQITSDSYRPYQSIVRKHLLGRLDFATMQKLYATPYDMKAEATRRYAAPICTGVRVRVQAGAPREDRINTSFVERANLSVRHFTKRFSRLGLEWSRTLENHRHAVAVFVCAHNFCKVHSTLGTTPAHGAKITEGPWTIEKLIEQATATN